MTSRTTSAANDRSPSLQKALAKLAHWRLSGLVGLLLFLLAVISSPSLRDWPLIWCPVTIVWTLLLWLSSSLTHEIETELQQQSTEANV